MQVRVALNILIPVFSPRSSDPETSVARGGAGLAVAQIKIAFCHSPGGIYVQIDLPFAVRCFHSDGL